MMFTKKDKLWLLLKEIFKDYINENFYFLYQGHGWSNNYIVLYTQQLDYLLKLENDEQHIKIISEDGVYKNMIDISGLLQDNVLPIFDEQQNFSILSMKERQKLYSKLLELL